MPASASSNFAENDSRKAWLTDASTLASAICGVRISVSDLDALFARDSARGDVATALPHHAISADTLSDAQREALRALGRIVSTYLEPRVSARLAHDLRTPLTSIRGARRVVSEISAYWLGVVRLPTHQSPDLPRG